MNKSFTYHPMHMHIHSCFQPGASMALQMYQAQKLGMKYIWFTDHDTRTGFKQYPVSGFEFDEDSLIKHDGENRFYGFEESKFNNQAELKYEINTKEKSLSLSSKADESSKWQSAGIHFVSSRTRHTHSLLMGIALSLELTKHTIPHDSRLILDIKLSQRPPDYKNAHLIYVMGDTSNLHGPHTQIIPLKLKNGKITMELSKDISDSIDIGGTDNVFDTITIELQTRNNARASITIKNFEINIQRGFEEVHEMQKLKAAELSSVYGVSPFVAFEVSDAGEHKNCFTTSVPTIDYRKYKYRPNVYDAVSHIKKHGGIFAINHPFKISMLKRKTFDEIERLKILAKMQAELTANKAYGADLIEVGFPMGNNGFSINDYLLLWDMLSHAGLFLCGYGDNDSHRNDINWFGGNNFAAYIGVDTNLKHPIDESYFTEALKKGRVYTANPVKINGRISFNTKQGHQQGSVFDTKTISEVPIEFRAENTTPGWSFRLIENGHVIHTEKITGTEFTYSSVLSEYETSISFQRAELYDENGICILLTNPIYLVNTDLFAGEIPEYRKAIL